MSKETSEIKSVNAKHPWKNVGISDPRARLKNLSDYASTVEMDRNIPPQRYYRSGVEMIRMADMCMKDNNLEYAYILYVKFITIFVEKIRNHPQFDTVSLKDKEHNQQTLRKVLPKAEELKKQLLEQYQTELNKYLEDVKEREKIEKERLKQEELEKYFIIFYKLYRVSHLRLESEILTLLNDKNDGEEMNLRIKRHSDISV